MPRAKPYTCRKCGRQYVTARCPRCYPPKKRRGGGGSRGGRGRRRRASDVLGRQLLAPAVNLDAIPEREDELRVFIGGEGPKPDPSPE
jgi:hypothetical protein